MNHAYKDIRRALQTERKRQGLTQRDFAERTGATQAGVSRFEKGTTDIRLSTAIEFARALDLELMLIPRQHIPAVNALTARPSYDAAGHMSGPRPAYSLDGEDDD